MLALVCCAGFPMGDSVAGLYAHPIDKSRSHTLGPTHHFRHPCGAEQPENVLLVHFHSTLMYFHGNLLCVRCDVLVLRVHPSNQVIFFMCLRSMPLARSISVTSLSGLDDWDEEFDLEDAVLFEIAWEVANKGTLLYTYRMEGLGVLRLCAYGCFTS